MKGRTNLFVIGLSVGVTIGGILLLLLLLLLLLICCYCCCGGKRRDNRLNEKKEKSRSEDHLVCKYTVLIIMLFIMINFYLQQVKICIVIQGLLNCPRKVDLLLMVSLINPH